MAAQLCSCYEYSSTVTSWRWKLKSRGNVDAMTRGWMTAETPEASSYSWCLEWIRTLKARLDFRYEISDLVFLRIIFNFLQTYIHIPWVTALRKDLPAYGPGFAGWGSVSLCPVPSGSHTLWTGTWWGELKRIILCTSILQSPVTGKYTLLRP